jgi:16S rRNA (guanine527-N7)-methyltransferase
VPAGDFARRRLVSRREPGLELSSSQRALLERYVQLVLAWRPRLNLTAAGTEERATRVLVGDALDCLPYLPDRGLIVDVGSGSGTPGIPVAVARPGTHVTLVEASRKKAGFLEVVVRELALRNADVVFARAETLGRSPAHRERYDAATARAVAPLPVLAELVLPLVRVGGVAVLPRGPSARDALRGGGDAMRALGGAGDVRAGEVIVVRKVAPTPPAYPRGPGIPARRPLGARARR